MSHCIYPRTGCGDRSRDTKIAAGVSKLHQGQVDPLPCVYEAIGIGAGCLTYPITATVRFPTLCVCPVYLGLLPCCTKLKGFSTINFLALHVHVVVVTGLVHFV